MEWVGPGNESSGCFVRSGCTITVLNIRNNADGTYINVEDLDEKKNLQIIKTWIARVGLPDDPTRWIQATCEGWHRGVCGPLCIGEASKDQGIR